MNVAIVHKANVNDEVLDGLARELPSIISELLEIRGGKMAILKPEQISLQFSQASSRDIGADIRIIVLARSLGPRTSVENKLAAAILEKVMAMVKGIADACSITVRLYLTEIGAAEYVPE
ncbi:hypothetical protein KOM00_01845 [Geomonas sp. Red69]|uniref:5-carboxymethyl-2-hydroxymuconate isomerase n=1 Tax=Geomonas diazotrophica TaxID=2843197 RepID=A0ABX8JGG3_9BACT|nr:MULTISPECIES: hypothetical protein [Geomonas]MBU5635473.1 hypothetical protein [Geomonas diazotrophica]QWV97478.1 hypothetical protein KP005_19420 [Geomonas nitrogeniifigens]QXE86617.1 hypothetical protein KP003_20075 [Geomonas nitrogeniifigens]